MKTSQVKINYVLNAFYKILEIIIPLVTLPYLTRTLGPASIGDYTFEYSIAYYLTQINKLGLDTYGIRVIARARDDNENLSLKFWELYIIQLFMMAVSILVFMLYLSTLSGNVYLSICALPLVISGGLDVTWFFSGIEKFKTLVSRNILIKLFTILGIFFLVKCPTDTWIYLLLVSLSAFIGQIYIWTEVLNIIKPVKISRLNWKQHIKQCVIMFMPTIAVSIYKIMDKIMLGAMSTNIELGYYHSSENIIKVPMALVTALGTTMLPYVTHFLSNGDKPENQYVAFVKRNIVISVLITTVLGFGIMTVANIFVPLFYGDGYEKCVIIYYILLPSTFFLSFANVIRMQYLLPNDRDKTFVISLFSGAFLNVIINALLIPRDGAVGAAIGTLVAEIVVCVYQAIASMKDLPIVSFVLSIIPFVAIGSLIFLIFKDFGEGIVSLRSLTIKIIYTGCIYVVLLGVSYLLYYFNKKKGDLCSK